MSFTSGTVSISGVEPPTLLNAAPGGRRSEVTALVPLGFRVEGLGFRV